MKLWLLRHIAGRPEWEPWYDKAFGHVVRAETEQQARELAAEAAGAEAPWDWDAIAPLAFMSVHGHPRGKKRKQNPWLDAAASTCVELTTGGAAEVVMTDLHSA